MEEVYRDVNMTNISFAQTYLRAEGFNPFVIDTHISALEGGISLFPRRIMVSSDNAAAARRLIADLGLEPYDG